MAFLSTANVAFLVVALAAIGISLLLRKGYTVHDKGVVVVSGASSGIGRHFVEHFARQKPNMFILAGVRSSSDAEKIKEIGLTNLQPLILDVADKTSCVDATKKIKLLLDAHSLPLIALVNNAGTARNFPIEFHDVNDARYLFEINYFGLMQLTQLLLPMLRQSKGRIINISSVAGVISTTLNGVYSSTKFAVEALSDALRRETAALGVSVSVVEPAYVKSSIFGKVIEATKTAGDLGASKEVYPHLYTDEKLAKKKKDVDNADDPIVVTRAIEHAISDPYPSTRYVVASAGGFPASLLRWVIWILGDRAEDALTELF